MLKKIGSNLREGARAAMWMVVAPIVLGGFVIAVLGVLRLFNVLR